MKEQNISLLSSVVFLMSFFLPFSLTIESHVHGFIEEIGQGIQHIASRVDDLPAFVQRGNDFREITGEVSLNQT